MGNTVDAISRNFERFLRWAYPGVLFLALLYMSRPDDFRQAYQIVGHPWLFLIGGLGIGAAIYLFQINVLTQLPSAFAQITHWNSDLHPNPTCPPEVPPAPRCGLGCLARWFNPQAINIEKRMEQDRQTNHHYLNYLWGTFHATSTTGWLTIVFFYTKSIGSLLYEVPCWVVLTPAVIFLFGASYLFLRLTRVRRLQSKKHS